MTTLPLLIAAPFVGSFLGVLVDRLPRGESVALDRSRCRGCGRALGPLELVPVVSWLVQRGRCRGCGCRIPAWLPGIELAALAVAGWAVAVVPEALALPSAVLGWALLALSAIDARTGFLPERLTLPLLAGGLAVNAWIAGGVPVDALVGAVAGWGLFAAIIVAYRAWRGRDGMGWGDATLLAVGGAWTGWAGLPGTVLVAGLAGLAGALAAGIRRPDAAVPFGPALAFGIWVTWLHGPLALVG